MDLIVAVTAGFLSAAMLTYYILRYLVLPRLTNSREIQTNEPVLPQFIRIFSGIAEHSSTPSVQIKLAEYKDLLTKSGSFMGGLNAAEVYTVKFIFAVAGALGTLLFLAVCGMPAGFILLAVPVVAVLGYLYPADALKTQVRKRAAQFVRQLPETLDVMRLIIESGGNFNSAADAVIMTCADGPVKEDFVTMKNELLLGISLQQALLNLADRVDSKEAGAVFITLSQSIEMGTSISENLREISANIRKQARLKAQEKAQKAVIKMSFPLLFLILPGVFIVLLGPLIVQFISR